MNVINFLKIDSPTVYKFLKNVQGYYINNYYHNAMHATDVTTSVACILNSGLNTRINDLEQMSILVAATCHDMGHPGFNNGFMTSQQTSLSIVYNDQSVLENYHCSLTFQI